MAEVGAYPRHFSHLQSQVLLQPHYSSPARPFQFSLSFELLHKRPSLRLRHQRNSSTETKVSKVEELISGFGEDKRETEHKEEEDKDDSFPLVVEEEDPTWSDDENDGWGFSLSDCFDERKMKILDVDDDDNDKYSPLDDVNWNKLSPEPPVIDFTAKQWDDVMLRDLSPLVLLAFQRYHKPFDNMKMRLELDKSIQIFWNANKPAPRAMKFDAATEEDLASALKIEDTPSLLFIKYGKVLLRLTDILPAEQLANIMAYFYCGAVQPKILKGLKMCEEYIPVLR
eukprot:TRINITY_DN17827_c0_g1_i1.p1 TRINITY_DN17827_c0_g1~~TRINITY_DN17827_c0_g1_i1.p1  ORF type:complete len:284 (+),score=57.13 TRINITY_DN17827_c0_g1_i1:134-985(+)